MRDHIYSWTRLGGHLQEKKKKIVIYVMYVIPLISNRILDFFWELPCYGFVTDVTALCEKIQVIWLVNKLVTGFDMFLISQVTYENSFLLIGKWHVWCFAHVCTKICFEFSHSNSLMSSNGADSYNNMRSLSVPNEVASFPSYRSKSNPSTSPASPMHTEVSIFKRFF